jgi:lipid-binding SYLF domain-containing protein
VATTLALAPLVASENEPGKRLHAASAVLSEVMAAPDKAIPDELLENAHCIVIVPELKTAAFVAGGKYGKGFLSCRNKTGAGWSAPGAVRIEGGSVGFQLGGSSTDLIMLVMNERGADKLLADKFTIGGEASVAGGPVGRTATRRCTPTSCPGRDHRGSSQASRSKEPRCARISTTTLRCMASASRIAPSSPRVCTCLALPSRSSSC